MLPIYSNTFVSTSSVRLSNNKPEERQRKILEELEGRGYTVTPTLSDEKKVLTFLEETKVHDPQYIEFLQNVWTDYTANPDKQFLPTEEGLIPLMMSQRKIRPEQRYLHRIGYYAEDTTTPIPRNLWEMSVSCATNTLASVEAKDKVAYISNTLPGHHAKHSKYSGYCFLNYDVIAATRYQQLHLGAKVAILDLDYHAGNGTYDMLKERTDIMTISLHIDPLVDYPFTEGFADEVGEGRGVGYHWNKTLPTGCTIDEYLYNLSAAVSDIQEFDPELLIVSFGGDTLCTDPEISEQGGLALQVKDYTEVGACLKPLVERVKATRVIQQGGYDMAEIGSVLGGLLDAIV